MCNINICKSHSCNDTPKKLVTENKAWEHRVLKLNIACVGAPACNPLPFMVWHD